MTAHHLFVFIGAEPYLEQGGVDTRALLGHLTDATSDLYANSRGLEPIKVKISVA